MYALRDAEGKFVAHARTSAAAHRSSRRARHLGASVNRVGGVDPHALKAAKSDLRFARKHGSLTIGQTKVGTVTVRWSQPHQQFVLTQLGTPTSPPLGLATGNTAKVAPVLASLYVVEYENQAVPRAARRFAPSTVFRVVVIPPMFTDEKSGAVYYEGPSLSTARVKAKIALSKIKMPVSVFDEHGKKIVTYKPDDPTAWERSGQTLNAANVVAYYPTKTPGTGVRKSYSENVACYDDHKAAVAHARAFAREHPEAILAVEGGKCDANRASPRRWPRGQAPTGVHPADRRPGGNISPIALVHPADRGVGGNISGLHHRIAVALGWSDEAVRSFSLRSLRDVVRPVDPSLANEISQTIASGRI